jgi:hypothetical protein
VAVDAGSVYSSIRIRLDQLDNDLKGVYARLNKLEGSISKAPVKGQNAFKAFFSFLKSTGIGAFLALGTSVAALTRYLDDSMKVARDAQETFSKFNVVFGDITGQANEVASAFANSFDLADATAKKLLSDTGDLITGMGATQSEALDLSLRVNTLAADLASFTNIEGGAETAAHALTSAMLGEREQAKRLGIVIREVDVEQKLMERGQNELTGEALLLAKAQATLDIAMSQSKNAIGDYARTADSAANAQKRASESSKQLQVAIGTALNPVATITANLFTTIADKITETVEAANKMREAQKADKQGNATLEQRIRILRDTIDKYTQIAERNENLGLINDSISREIIANAQEEIKMLEKEQRLQSAAQRAAEKRAADDQARQQKERERRSELEAYLNRVDDEYAKTEDGKIEALKKVIAEFEEYAKTASATAPQVQAVLRALNLELESMINKEKVLTQEEQRIADAREQSAERQNEITDSNRELYNINKENVSQLEARGKTEVELLDIARQQKIASIESSDADQKYKDRAIESTNELYEMLKNDAAWQQFAANAANAFSAFNSVFSALTDLVTTLANNQRDAELNALKDIQEAEQEYLDNKFDAYQSELDKELQAQLYAAGLAEATTEEQLQNELNAAIAAGDAERQLDLENKLTELAIRKEFDERQQELDEQRAYEEKALEERQAKERAEINYKAEMTAWRMKVLSATANAAAAIVGALSAPPFFPFNLPSVAATTAAGALQVAAVSAAKPILQYATGGIVPGTRTVADSVPAILKPREAVLTESQQAEFMRLANGGGASGGQAIEIPITLRMMDDRVLAKAVVRVINNRIELIDSGSVVKK